MHSRAPDFQGKILDWLDKHGYPLEMEVAAAFKKAGFTVALSEPYADFESQIQREIDVSALRWSDMNQKASLQLSVMVECKRSPGYPWIVFVSQAQPDWFPPFQVLTSSGARIFLIDLLKQEGVIKRLSPLYRFGGGYLGHGIVQALKDDQSTAHHAISASVKAAVHRASSFDKAEIIRTMTKGRTLSCLALPAIVVDGPLFECFLDKDMNVFLQAVEASALLSKATPREASSPIVRVVTREGLVKLIDNLTETADVLTQLAVEFQELLHASASNAYESVLRSAGPPYIG